MNEHEKRLREWIAGQAGLSAAMKTTLARELDGALAAIRAAALEEAGALADAAAKTWEAAARATADEAVQLRHDARGGVATDLGVSIRALITTPPASIPVERVREVLRGLRRVSPAFVEPRSLLDEIARRVGVEIHANAAARPSELRHWLNSAEECLDWCPACQENVSRGLNPDGTSRA